MCILNMSTAPRLRPEEIEAALGGVSDDEFVMVDEDEDGFAQQDMSFLWFSSILTTRWSDDAVCRAGRNQLETRNRR